MDDSSSKPDPVQATRARLFPTTHWTTLLTPIRERGAGAEAALEQLCEIYRRPLVACARHLLREDESEAEDIVHDYISALLRREDLTKVRRENGKFRAYLSAGIRHQVINFMHARRAQKRGGGVPVDSLEAMLIEPADAVTAEVVLCRDWIQASIAEVLRLMEEEWTSADKAAEFNDLKEFALSSKCAVPRAELAAKYGVTVNAIDAKISRFRRRFRDSLKELIAQTVSQPEEVDEEIRFLMSKLAG